MGKKIKQMMLLDPQCEYDNLVLCFKNETNCNNINGDQFVCDIPLNTAIQLYKYSKIHWMSLKIDIDVEVQNYLESKIKELEG